MIISSYRFSFTCMIQSKVQFPFFRVDYLCPRFSITRVTLWIHCSKVQVIYISRWIIIRISRFSKLNFLCDFYIVIDIVIYPLLYISTNYIRPYSNLYSCLYQISNVCMHEIQDVSFWDLFCIYLFHVFFCIFVKRYVKKGSIF